MIRVEQFIRERQYLQNVTPKTIESYRYCLKFLPNENPSQAQLHEMVIALRQAGHKETGLQRCYPHRQRLPSLGQWQRWQVRGGL